MDPFDPEVLACPYAFWARQRREEPVLPLVMPDSQHTAYLVTRHRDVEAILGDPELYSSRRDPRIFAFPEQPPELLDVFDREGGYRFVPTFIGTDSPRYEFFRRVPEDYLRPEMLARWQPAIKALADELAQGLPDRQPFDFLAAYADRLPVAVVRTLLGLPRGDEDRLAAISTEFFTMVDATASLERRRGAASALVKGQKYLAPRLIAYRDDPGDNLLSVIANADGPDGAPMTLEEALSLACAVIIGGNEAVRHALGTAAFHLGDDALWTSLRHDRALIPAFVEEAMRLASPANILPRLVTRDTELSGVMLSAGATVLTAFGSANRDETVFEDPLAFRLDRNNADAHLAFGFGSHRCAGQHLVRLELASAVESLLSRLERFSLAVDRSEVRYAPRFAVRALEALPVVAEHQCVS
jgi:cytochrome P450